MVPASMSQFNWEAIELGGVRPAWLYLVLNPIKHTYTHAHRHTHTHVMPAGATEFSLCRQRHLLGTQEVFYKRPPPLSLTHTHTHTHTDTHIHTAPPPPHAQPDFLMESVTQPHVVPDLLTPAG